MGRQAQRRGDAPQRARAPGLPAAGPHHRVLALQRAFGNQATGRMLAAGRLQRVVKIGDSPLEPDAAAGFLNSLAATCDLPPGLLERLQLAIGAEEEKQLVVWLREQNVLPRGQRTLQAAIDEALLGRGLRTIQALAHGLFAQEGRPVADVPGAPAVQYKGVWYTRAQFKDRVTADLRGFFDEAKTALLDELPLGSSYKMSFEVVNAITALENRRKEPPPKPRQETAQPPPEPREEAPKATPVTSLAGSLQDAEEYEREIGRLAAKSGITAKVALAMSEQVVKFVEAFDPKLYAEIGTANPRTAGAVGKDPETVKAALTDPHGTLHEKLTHVLNFKAVFANLCADPRTRAKALQIAKEAGFDTRFIREGSSKEHDVVHERKLETVEPSATKDAPNTRTVDELGIPFSERERALWKDRDVPEFGVGSQQVKVKSDSTFAQEKQAQGFPLKSGPSTHTVELFEMHELLGLQGELTLEEIFLAATGYLLPIGAHSLIELQHVAEVFGLAPVKSPELYGRLLATLRRGSAKTNKTAGELRALLSTNFDAFHETELAAAHHKLLSSGYVFLAFHGTNKKAARSIHDKGFDEAFERRKDPKDPWRGVYVTPDVQVAKGYLVPQQTTAAKPKDPEESQTVMLRIYAPGELVQACIQARLPLDDSRALAEIGRRLPTGTLAPPHGDHVLIGRERSHAESAEEANSLEAVVSWSVAVQCIALPSLHTAAALSEVELGLPQQVTMPQALSFEQGEGSQGGLDLTSPGDKDWAPSGPKTDWDKGEYVKSSPKGGPTRREAEILRRLGLKVTFGATWQEVAAESIGHQVNAHTLIELLPALLEVPPQSPIWSDFVHRFTAAAEHSMIAPGLYLSGWQAATDLVWQEGHVGAVLNCCQFAFPRQPGIQYEHVNVTGYSNAMFEWVHRRIEELVKRGLLVHCVEGKNRSATLVTAYLMKANRWDALRAIRLVTSRRPWAEPDADALTRWEEHLAGEGLLPARRMPPAEREDEWIGMEVALEESMAQLQFEGAGRDIGLDRYMTLHNVSGAANNCLVNAIAGALGQPADERRSAEIGDLVRHSRVGVERNGFLNAQAVPRILAELGASGRRVVIIDTTGRVDAPGTGDADTYSAEIVNATGGGTLIVVNRGNVHFGYGLATDGHIPVAIHDQTTDGNQWVQFPSSVVPHALGPGLSTPQALQILGLDPRAVPGLDVIRRSYMTLVLQHHPDKGGDEATFKTLVEAYEQLTKEKQGGEQLLLQ